MRADGPARAKPVPVPNEIPYKGSAPAITDVLGGQVAVFFDNMASALPHVKSGRARRGGVGITPAELAAFMEKETQKWARVVREANIKSE